MEDFAFDTISGSLNLLVQHILVCTVILLLIKAFITFGGS